MVEENIHKIWRIWGDGGLFNKLGPERTIRELKKRGEAGAIIGWTFYKLLIDKWMEVSLRARDPGERGPAEDFMLAAGEDEWVQRIEELHTQYPNGIPRSVQHDLRDEYNLSLEKKIGRRIPLSVNDASKQDIEESKRIAAEMGAGEIQPLAKKPVPKAVEKEKEKPKPKPEIAPPTVKPEEPVKVTTPTLDLMEEEIRKRMEALKKKRASGELEAGENKVRYDPYTLTDAQIEEMFKNAIAGAKQWIKNKAWRLNIKEKRNIIEIAFTTGTDIIKLIEIYGTEEYKRTERIKSQYKKGAGGTGELVCEEPIDNRPLKDRYKDFVKELRAVIENLPPREKGGFERGMVYSKEYNRLRKKYNIPMSIPIELIKQVGEVPTLGKSEIAKSIISTMAPPHEIVPGETPALCPGITGFEMCKYCQFKYTVTSPSFCPYKPEFRGTIGEGDIKKIAGIVARETGESETEVSRSFLEYIRRLEMVKNLDSLPELKKYYDNVDGIQVLNDYHKLELKRFIIMRMQQIIDYYEKGKPAFPEKFRENNERKDEDVMTEPRDYSQWTVGDFEALIAGLEDIEDLEELNEYVDASDKLTQDDAITVRNRIKTRIDELAEGYAELAKIGS